MAKSNKIVVADSSLESKLHLILNPVIESKEGDFFDEDNTERLTYSQMYQPTTVSVEQKGLFADLKMGDFYTKYGVIGSKLKGAVLAMWPSRAYFDKTTKKRLCSSSDGKTPMHTDFASQCRTCPKARYSKGSPSPCTQSINILFQLEDLSRPPFVISFSKTSYALGRDIAKQAKMFGPNLYDATFTIGSKKPEGAAYRTPTVEACDSTEEEIKGYYQQIYTHFQPIVTETVNRDPNRAKEPELVDSEETGEEAPLDNIV